LEVPEVYKNTGSTMSRCGSGRMTKVTQRVKELVNQQMEKDDETTATQLHRLMNDTGINISLRTVLR
jgi:Fe2+ or Zn2+ uptake regulation protein